MRLALALSLALTACYREVGLDELGAYSVVFEGKQSATGEVKGVVGFLNDTNSPSTRGFFRCRRFGARFSATLGSGQELARTEAECAPGEFEERFVVPEGIANDDLNVLFSDGERTSRVVVPEALRSLHIESEELTLIADQDTPVDLGLMRGEYLFEISAAFFDQNGTQRWQTLNQSYYDSFRAGPGEPPLSGRVVVSGTVLREAPVCRDFVGCRSETRFSLSVPARY